MREKVKTYLYSTLLFLILLIPNLYACGIASDLSSPLKAAAYLLVVCAGLVLPMLFLRRRTYFIACGIASLFCAPIEIASLHLNHNPASATFVGLFYATNWREITGILSVIWPLLLVLASVWVLYFVLAARLPNEWIIPRKIGLWSAGVVLPLLFAGGIFIFSWHARNIYNLQETGEVVRFAKDLTLMKFYKIFPYNIYLNTFSVAKEKRAMKKAQAALEPFRFGLQEQQGEIEELYILVIGEAARSDNFALNGYHRPTTPLLGRRSNIVSYPYIYSQAGTTEQSVPHMISRIPATRHESVHSEKTLPEAFQEAGYEAAWLTNKSRALYLERVLEVMDRRFETGKDMSVTNNYDELLLGPLRETLYDGKSKQFIVLHTMGSHWKYDTRYPSCFEQFTPSIGEDFRLTMINPENRDRLVNAYDNTILYTDYFLDSVCTIAEQRHIPAIVMYMSDHGENLYDDERGLILHGNYSTSRWLFHVPLIVWYSDEYAALYPEKIHQLQAHHESRDNSSVIFHSMIDAAGMQYKNDTASNAEMHSRSIFSQAYCAPETLYVLTAEGECIPLEEE